MKIKFNKAEEAYDIKTLPKWLQLSINDGSSQIVKGASNLDKCLKFCSKYYTQGNFHLLLTDDEEREKYKKELEEDDYVSVQLYESEAGIIVIFIKTV